jgi:hypothetical protein
VNESQLQRFYSRIRVNDKTGCWEWAGALCHDGQGRMLIGPGQVASHRLSWEHFVSAIPEPKRHYAVRQTCGHRDLGCVNPLHLELVTLGDALAAFPHTITARGRRQTHCRKGHEFTPENTGINGKSGARYCLRCRDDRFARQRARAAAQRKRREQVAEQGRIAG